MKEILSIAAIIGMVVAIGIAEYVETARQNLLIDTGVCSLVFTEDDGDEHYVCDDGVKFEREYD